MEKRLRDPILITGCARSGTSMVAGMVHMCGEFGGKMSGATKNNQKGMFENSRIREEITKPYLRRIGVDVMGQYPLPDVNNLIIPTDWRQKVEQTMIDEGYKSGVWMYKGAKMCLMWPVWHYAFPDAKWVIVRRKTCDIIQSCLKTGFMRAFSRKENQYAVGVTSEEDGWLWWIKQHEQRFVEMINEGLNCKVVWPERMGHGDYEQMYETLEWLGLSWKSEVLSFVDPLLWHARKTEKETI